MEDTAPKPAPDAPVSLPRRAFRRLRARLTGWMPGSDPGSRFRNLLSFLAVFWSLVILAEITLAGFGWPLFGADALSFALALFWMLMSVVVFYLVCVGVIFLHSEARPILAGRLLRDTAISAVFTMASFALAYRYVGVSGRSVDGQPLCLAPAGLDCETGPLDQLYFSVVTFSTLGYGDMALLRWRLLSAIEAILGNLHLGIFVGAVFYYLATPAKARRPEAAPLPQPLSGDQADGHEGDGRDASQKEKAEADIE